MRVIGWATVAVLAALTVWFAREMRPWSADVACLLGVFVAGTVGLAWRLLRR